MNGILKINFEAHPGIETLADLLDIAQENKWDIFMTDDDMTAKEAATAMYEWLNKMPPCAITVIEMPNQEDVIWVKKELPDIDNDIKLYLSDKNT